MEYRLNHFVSILGPSKHSPDALVSSANSIYTIKDKHVAQYLQLLYQIRFKDADLCAVLPEKIAENSLIKTLSKLGIIISREHTCIESLHAAEFLYNPFLSPILLNEDDVLMWTNKSQGILKNPIPELPPLNIRQSNRKFEKNKKIPHSVINKIISSAYAPIWRDKDYPHVVHRPVASAGGFYPLEIYIIKITGKKKNISCGRFNKSAISMNIKKTQFEISDLQNAFLGTIKDCIHEGVTCCIVTMNTEWICKKYGMRSILYGALEAGSVMQIFAQESKKYGIESCQIGGYLEKLIMKLIACRETEIILSTMLFGYGENT